MNISTVLRCALLGLVSLSSSVSIVADPLNPTSSNIREFQEGDRFSYAFSVAGSGTAETGALVIRIGESVTNPSGKNCFIKNMSSTLSGINNDLTIERKILLHQDDDRSIFECGFYDDKKQQYVFIKDSAQNRDGLTLLFKSPMSLGHSASELTAYTDDSWKDCTRSVDAIETVSIRVGNFKAYKISESCSTNADNSRTLSTIWITPELFIIKESGKGGLISGEIVLTDHQLN